MSKLEKFMKRVSPEPNSGCWLWLGPVFQVRNRTKGYGRYGKNGRLAHRVSWELFNNLPIPSGKMVCHTCDNVICVNPDHLFLGTAQSNSDDKVSKGRQARGFLKLRKEQAMTIKASPESPSELAARFGISRALVYAIRKGDCWGWL
jgi:hypothetical protein